MLRDEGRVFIRGALADSRDLFPTTLRFFPGIAPIFDELPSIAETVGTFRAHGFALDAHRRVEQQISASLREFADRTRLRADTSLALLSDDEFEAGMATLDDAAARVGAGIHLRDVRAACVSNVADRRGRPVTHWVARRVSL